MNDMKFKNKAGRVIIRLRGGRTSVRFRDRSKYTRKPKHKEIPA